MTLLQRGRSANCNGAEPKLVAAARQPRWKGLGLAQSDVLRRSSLIKRTIGKLALAFAVLALAGLSWLLYCEHLNSAEVAFPTQTQLRSSFNQASAWIVQNREAVLRDNNSMLWLFVREAGRLANDARLESLANEYQAQSTQGTITQFFFDSAGVEHVRGANLALSDDWQAYQRLFVYGATCNSPLRFDPEVVAMLSPSACEGGHAWLRNPWCRTHQLIGLRFVQRNHCEPDEDTAQTIASVQAGILTELQWDFRVEDAYLQKVWTLVESGRRNEIKAIWVRRILDAQLADGGWSGAAVIASLPGGRAVAWQGGLVPRAGVVPTANFHATAQGVYLMALLLNDHTPAVAASN
jgi:hypothetical protein